jgi:hypothetical protein
MNWNRLAVLQINPLPILSPQNGIGFSYLITGKKKHIIKTIEGRVDKCRSNEFNSILDINSKGSHSILREDMDGSLIRIKL